MFIGWTWWRLRSMDNQISALTQERSKLQSDVNKNKQAEKDAEELDRWLAGDVPWLDVMYRLSTEGPKGEYAMLTALKADVDAKGAAKMALDVYGTDAIKVGRELRAAVRLPAATAAAFRGKFALLRLDGQVADHRVKLLDNARLFGLGFDSAQ